MAKKLPDLYESGLGDLSVVFHNQGVADLSWLAIDEEDYRAFEALPLQQLDIIPEMQKALLSEVKEDELNVPKLIPLKPHTIVNHNPLSNDYGQTSPIDQTAPIRNRVAKMVMMGMENNTIAARLKSEFGIGDIRRASEDIKEVIAERGLLGNVYVNARHFPRACQDPKERKFARTVSKNALYVLGCCDNSNGCNCQKSGICQTFGGKRVVSEVPYDNKTLAHYMPKFISEKRISSEIDGISDYKETLRTAFTRTPIALRSEGVKTIQTRQIPKKPIVTQQQYDEYWHRKFSAAPVEKPLSPSYVKYARRMMEGFNDIAILASLKDKEVSKLVTEYGILGHSYLDMDVLEGCKNTLALMHRRASSGQSNAAGLGNDLRDLHLDYVLRRNATCTNCKGAEDGACAQICKCTSIVNSKPLVDRNTFILALQRAGLQKRISVNEIQNANSRSASVKNWATATAYINLYNVKDCNSDPVREYSGIHATLKTMEPVRTETTVAQMDPEEVRRTVSHMMNSGLSGRALQEALLKRYSRDDLIQVPEVGRIASLDDGVQGVFFIDPTAYMDYGKGCKDGSKIFHNRGASNVLASDSCTGCMSQTAPGWCCKYAKTLIRHVPTQVRQAAIQARRTLPVIQTAPIDNSVEKYNLAGELHVEPAIVRKKSPDIRFSESTIDPYTPVV